MRKITVDNVERILSERGLKVGRWNSTEGGKIKGTNHQLMFKTMSQGTQLFRIESNSDAQFGDIFLFHDDVEQNGLDKMIHVIPKGRSVILKLAANKFIPLSWVKEKQKDRIPWL